MTFKVIIASGKDFNDAALLTEKLDFYLQSKQPDIEIVTGFSLTSDALAKSYATSKNYPVKHFPGGFRHMAAMIRYSNAAIIFHDGKSKGADQLIRDCKDSNVNTKVITYAPIAKPDKRSSSQSQQNDPLSDILTAGRPRKRKISPIIVDGVELIPDIKEKPKPKKSAIPVDPGWKNIYQAAHERWFAKEYPKTYADKHYCEPNYPDPKTTNGITSIIIDHLKWEGHYSNRQNVMGRQIGGITKTRSGATFDDRKFIKASTRKGASDISAAIHGRMIAIEVKNEHTKDTMKENQEKEQKRVEAAGGVYVVIQSVGQYFAWYEKYMADHPQQPNLFGS